MLVNFVNSLVCFPARYNKWLYFICIQLNFFVIAGIYSLFPVPVCSTFGPKYGAQIYSVIMSSVVLASFSITFAMTVLYPIIG